MLKEIVERKHHFTTPNKMYYGGIEENGYLDFHGNRKEVSAAFKYRIYDEKLAILIQEVVKCINDKKWIEASKLIEEYMNEVKMKESLIEFINSEMKRMGNTDVKISNIRLCQRSEVDALVDLSFTWYLNGWEKPTTLTDVIIVFREGKWISLAI